MMISLLQSCPSPADVDAAAVDLANEAEVIEAEVAAGPDQNPDHLQDDH